MALLTDPTQEIGPLKLALVKYQYSIYVIMYFGCIVWLCSLAHDNFSAETYFSENALLPGLVQGEYFEENEAISMYDEFMSEKKSEFFNPYEFIHQRFKRLHMESYIHNFTVNIPFVANKKLRGRNVYAILRAPRSASTEALVLSVPYRNYFHNESSTLPGLAIMFSLAKFFRRQKYWAKDVIFLVTEYEHLGIQAWLDAYHGTTCGTEGVLISDDLEGRSGSIQAALNLEISSFVISHVDVKLSGLNGQLPNLDLVNLVHRICSKEAVQHTFYNKDPKVMPEARHYSDKLKTMLSMVITQAIGLPDGNHGLFHRFGIESVTLKAYPSKGRGGNQSVFHIGRVLEGLFRSLNNLLERFHQSYFFYLLPAYDRYVSIGYYMPCVAMLIGCLFIKSFTLWINAMGVRQTTKNSDSSPGKINDDAISNLMAANIIILVHAFGFAIIPFAVIFVRGDDQATLESYLFAYHAAILVLSVFVPPVLLKFFTLQGDWSVLQIFGLIELGAFLLCTSMHNFSFSYIIALYYVPLSILTISLRRCRQITRLFWLILHPVIVLQIVIFTMLYINSGKPLIELLVASCAGTGQKLLEGVSDTLLYGNWTYTVISNVLLPNWIIFWCLLNMPDKKADYITDKQKKLS